MAQQRKVLLLTVSVVVTQAHIGYFESLAQKRNLTRQSMRLLRKNNFTT